MALYPYQERVKALIHAGRSVVLQAPTGAGKTRAALAPFIEAFFDLPTGAFPRKCVYVVPMRVLANQFEAEFRDYAMSYQRRFRREIRVTIQTGERSEDKRFEGDLVFCTIDQFLSSYLTFPYGLPRRWANLNAGALIGAYIVCDEFHLLDPDSTLPSALYALQQLRYLAPVLIMTATFSEEMVSALAHRLDAEAVVIPSEEAHAIEMRGGVTVPRRRVWRVAEAELTAEVVLRSHRTRSLVLCNTVRRAQALYGDLCHLTGRGGSGTQVVLLHSRFLPEDRRRIEDALKARFRKAADREGSWIGVATQAIEVGVDITCEMLHTELAPASSLIQRAGRCARYPGEQGEVRVYPVESYAPYGRAAEESGDDPTWVREMKDAWTWITAHDGEALDFAGEQALVNAVATPRDRRVLAGIEMGAPARVGAIQRVLRGEQPDSRILVRDADSRRVLLHETPEVLLEAPFNAEGFSIQRGTLYGMVRSWLEREGEFPWRVLKLAERSGTAEEGSVEYIWEPLTSTAQVTGARVLAVHPALAGYLPDEGFVADRGAGGFRSSVIPDRQQGAWERTRYRLESYTEHIHQVLGAFTDMALNELAYAAPALERAAGWAPGSVTRAGWLVCLFHDVGKLSCGWQAWARAYQKKIGAPMASGVPVAHTDSDPDNPQHRAAAQAIQGRYPKPNHAAEGALAVGPVLVEAFAREKALVKAALTAIARHHTPFVDTGGKYELEARARDHLAAAAEHLPVEMRAGLNLARLKTSGLGPVATIGPDDIWGWLAYLLLARALRRADQEGTARGARAS